MYELYDPLSCNDGTVTFDIVTNHTTPYSKNGSVNLGRADAGETYVVHQTLDGADPSLEWRAFKFAPPGPLRRASRYTSKWFALIFSAMPFIFACLHVRQWRSCCGPNGIGRWRSGLVDPRGWIEPDDGGACVRVESIDLPAGSSVLFSGTARSAWSFRRAFAARAVAVIPGTRDEIFKRARGHASRAAWCIAFSICVSSLLIWRLLV